jgi:hypothetical protein
MESYRITKYNPAYRNLQGHFTHLTEWTSIINISRQSILVYSFYHPNLALIFINVHTK